MSMKSRVVVTIEEKLRTIDNSQKQWKITAWVEMSAVCDYMKMTKFESHATTFAKQDYNRNIQK